MLSWRFHHRFAIIIAPRSVSDGFVANIKNASLNDVCIGGGIVLLMVAVGLVGLEAGGNSYCPTSWLIWSRHSSISHLGVLVAPQMPMVETPCNQRSSISDALSIW